jgi:hypothetical protein
MRNGAESAVHINTAQEFDGSDAGARPDEAVSWGKIKIGADAVKVSYSSHGAWTVTNHIQGVFGGYCLFPVYSSQHLRKRRPIDAISSLCQSTNPIP